MTPCDGRSGRGEAPTSAIVRVSRRISAGVRGMTRGYPQRMADRLRVACVQLKAGAEKAANLERPERLVGEAAATGADVAVRRERWSASGAGETMPPGPGPLGGGEPIRPRAEWARRHSVSIVGGSITERREGREKLS